MSSSLPTLRRPRTHGWSVRRSCSVPSRRGGSCGWSGDCVSAPEGFTEYVLARQAALLRTAYLLTGHAQDAEDLVQASLVRVVPHWRRIRDDPESYVRRVMVNES